MKKEDSKPDAPDRNLGTGSVTGHGTTLVASFFLLLTCLACNKGFGPHSVSGTLGAILMPKGAIASSLTSHNESPNFTAEANPFLNSPYQQETKLKHVSVNSISQLNRELNKANRSNGHVSLDIEDGVYQLGHTLNIKADYIVLASKSGNPEKVILQGGKIKNAGIPVLIKVFANHFSIDGITLRNAKAHLIQIAGEHNADYPVIRNCIFQDSYQQFVKISYDKKSRAASSSDFGLVEDSVFQYSEGIGPNYYIGGIDLHAGNSWIIRNNQFRDIASPGGSIAQHAIHAWNNAYNTIVENNIIEDCDRAIGFGLYTRKRHPSIAFSHLGGIIRNNLIMHSDNNDPFADVGIIIEDSANTLIENNRIWLGHDYPNAIEYRFPSTQNVVIKNNITNKRIVSRNGARAVLSNNTTNAGKEDILGKRHD